MSSCMNSNCVEWEDIIQWTFSALQGGRLKFISLCKLSFGVVMYHLWK
jgi:hypothetical protein